MSAAPAAPHFVAWRQHRGHCTACASTAYCALGAALLRAAEQAAVESPAPPKETH